MASTQSSTPPRRSISPTASDDDDVERLMREPTPVAANELPVDDNDDNAGPQGGGSLAGSSSSTSDLDSRPTRVVAFQNERAQIRSLANKARLHPYQRQLAEDFVAQNSSLQASQLLVTMYAVENKLDSIISMAPPFTPGPALMTNIKSFITAVLLSSKLSAYKGLVPRDHVVSLVMRNRLHLPKTFDRDPAASKALKEAINDELAQIRNRLKKQIKKNVSEHVFDLATALIKDSGCRITVPLCGRVALFRKIYLQKPGEDFWDAVDAELIKVRKTATDRATNVCDQAKIDRYFKNLVIRDQSKYKGDTCTNYSIPDELESNVNLPVGSENLGSLADVPAQAPAEPPA